MAWVEIGDNIFDRTLDFHADHLLCVSFDLEVDIEKEDFTSHLGPLSVELNRLRFALSPLS